VPAEAEVLSTTPEHSKSRRAVHGTLKILEFAEVPRTAAQAVEAPDAG